MVKFYLMIAIIVVVSGCAAPRTAVHIYKEKVYQEEWCKKVGGKTEVVLDDRTRVDCLTDEYAVEAEFAKKWAESIGQSLFYAAKTDRAAGVLLIMERLDDKKYLDRLNIVAAQNNIKTWTITPAEITR